MMEKDEIGAQVAAMDDAYARNEADAYFAFFADDATIFVPGVGRWTKAEYQGKWTAMLAKGNGVAASKVDDLQIRTSPSGDAAAVSYQLLVTYRGLSPALAIDQDDDKILLMTETWFKLEGQWRVVHMDWSTVEPR